MASSGGSISSLLVLVILFLLFVNAVAPRHGRQPRAALPDAAAQHLPTNPSPRAVALPLSPLPRPTTFNIISVNLSSFNTQGPVLTNLEWDLALVQEARLVGDEPVLATLRRQGHTILTGIADVNGKSLVMAIACKGSLVHLVAPTGPRIQHHRWQPSDGAPISFTTNYAPADGSLPTLNYTSRVVAESLALHVSRARRPAIIAGDFNATSEQLSVTYQLNLAGWCDISAGPTCIPPNGGARRHIDHVWSHPMPSLMSLHNLPPSSMAFLATQRATSH